MNLFFFPYTSKHKHTHACTHTHSHTQGFRSRRDATQMGTVCVIFLKWIVINWKIKLLWRPQTHTETLMICAIQRVGWVYGTLLQDGCSRNPTHAPRHHLIDINIFFFSHTSHFVLRCYLPTLAFEGGNIYSELSRHTCSKRIQRPLLLCGLLSCWIAGSNSRYVQAEPLFATKLPVLIPNTKKYDTKRHGGWGGEEIEKTALLSAWKCGSVC